jgi:CubicO group peptidase (beta-lactamase class C family)
MGLGFQCVKTPTGVTDGLSIGTYGHGGAFGTEAWVDPIRKRAYILLIQRSDLENPDGSEMRLTFQKAALQITK